MSNPIFLVLDRDNVLYCVPCITDCLNFVGAFLPDQLSEARRGSGVVDRNFKKGLPRPTALAICIARQEKLIKS